MIFIFNTTGKQLTLKSAEKEDRVVLNLIIPDLEVTHPLCHVMKHNKSLADKMLTSYEEGVEIKGDLAKRSLTIEHTICFYTPTTNEFFNVPMNEDFDRDMYKATPRNMIVVVTSKDGTIDTNDKNVVGHTKYTFRQELSVQQFYLKWNDWFKLKYPVEIIVSDGGNAVKLTTSSVKDRNKDGREFNRNMLKRTVIKPTDDGDEKPPYKSEKKPYAGKPKYGKDSNAHNKSKYVRINDKDKNSRPTKGDGYTRTSNKSSGRRHNNKKPR